MRFRLVPLGSGVTVTVTGAEVLEAKVSSPLYCAVRLWVPPGKEAREVVEVPLTRGNVLGELGMLVVDEVRTVLPVGVAEPEVGVTVVATVADAPW